MENAEKKEKANAVLKEKEEFLKKFNNWMLLKDPMLTGEAEYKYDDQTYYLITDLPDDDIIEELTTLRYVFDAYIKLTLVLMRYQKLDTISFADVMNIEKSFKYSKKLVPILWDSAYILQLCMTSYDNLSRAQIRMLSGMIRNITKTTNAVSEVQNCLYDKFAQVFRYTTIY